MRSRPDKIFKPVPPHSGYLIPLPIDDLQDVFKVGVPYQRRWFASEVPVPKGIMAWTDITVLRPYAAKLAAACTLGGFPATLNIVNGRYVINGRHLDTPPTNVVLPGCEPVTLAKLFIGIQTNLGTANEEDALRWLEFIESNVSLPMSTLLRKTPRLLDLMR